MKQIFTFLGLTAVFFIIGSRVGFGQIVINEVLADPPGDLPGDSNGDGIRESFEDEFVEIVNIGSSPLDISGWTISDDDPTSENFQLFTFPGGTIIENGKAIVLFGGGTPSANCCGGSITFANMGRIGSALRNGGDVVELRDSEGQLIDTFAYGDATDNGLNGGSNQSMVRQPDGTGDFVLFTEASGAEDRVFSPGTTVSGSSVFDGSSPELLITEVVVTPTNGEFIEIYNPNPFTVDLSNIYLTDATLNNDPRYINIVNPDGAFPGGGSNTDFHARFPEGATIASGEFQTIAVNNAGSSGFFETYGIMPTYEMLEDGETADEVPDMRPAFDGSIDLVGNTQLSNGGKVAILYFWDGESDLVQDLDYVVWGDGAEASVKTGLSIDGPDADSDVSTYQDETPLEIQEVVSAESHEVGQSFQRTDLFEGSESQSGGNGIQGDDETSENLSETFLIAEATPNEASAEVPVVIPSLSISESSLNFGDVTEGSSSDITYILSGEDLLGNELAVVAGGSFQLSIDGTSFSDSLNIPIQSDSTIEEQTITVRFSPNSGFLNVYSTDIIHSTDNIVGESRASGSEIGGVPQVIDTAFKVVAWNIENFGSRSGDEAILQINNAVAVIDSIGADIYALQEIRSETDFNTILSLLNGYEGVLAQYERTPSQLLGFIWNTTTVDTTEVRVLLEDTGGSFYAGGRLPFLLRANANINGDTVSLNVVNIHANAGDVDYFNRVSDIGVLVDTLNTYFEDEAVIFLGDYNDDVDVATTTEDEGTARVTPYIDFITDEDFKVVTSVLSENSIITRDGSTNPIDHITISNELFDLAIEGTARTEFGAAFSVGLDFSTTTSDHFPVSYQFTSFVSSEMNDESEDEGVDSVLTSNQAELLNNAISVYPNPVSKKIIIDLTGLEDQESLAISLTNINGKVMLTDLMRSGELKEVDVEGILSGLYFFNIKSSSTNIVRRIVIQ